MNGWCRKSPRPRGTSSRCREPSGPARLGRAARRGLQDRSDGEVVMSSSKSILPNLCQKASLFVRTKGVACFSLGVADGRLHSKATYLVGRPQIDDFWISLDDPREFIRHVKTCIEQERPVYVDHGMEIGPLRSDCLSLLVPIVWRRAAIEEGDVPVEQTIGVMVFWDPRDSPEITDDDRSMAEGLAKQSAAVLVSERLNEVKEASIALAAAAVAIVLLDRDDSIHLINPMAERMLNGKPLLDRALSEIDQACQLSSLVYRARNSSDGQSSSTFTSRDGESFSASAQVANTGECVIVLSKVHMSSSAEQIVGQAAHELRTPLTIIQGYVMTVNALLEAGCLEENLDESREMLSAVEVQCSRMTRLLSQTLSVSRIQAGRQIEINRIWCDLSELSRTLLNEVSDAMSRHSLEVSIPDCCRANVDPDKILSVIDNLLRNAAKYSDPGEHIWFTIQMVDDAVSISVRDEGIGIPAADIDRIGREPGYRTEESLGQASGIGLGLVYVRKVVEGHGGTLTITSEPGKGSEFRVEIPVGDVGAEGVFDVG